LLIQSIERKADEMWLKFHSETPVAAERLTQFVRRRRGASLRPDGSLRFRLAAPQGEFFAALQNVLQELQPAH
jgi:hypothetical protein